MSEIEIDLLADIAKALSKIVQRLEDINETLEALVPEQEPTHHKNADGSNAGYGTYKPKGGT